MTTTPRVTVVVPSFNEPPAMLRASLASLRTQTLADFQCVVIDESTDDESAEACRAACAEDARFQYLRPHARIGLAASLHLGIASTASEYIARFDSDDVCMPERLETQVAFLDSHPEVSLVGSALEIIGDPGHPATFRPYPIHHEEIARGMQTTNTVAHPTVMFRRDAVDRHGSYDASFRYCEDLDLWLRWLNAGVVFANLPEALVRYFQPQTRRASRHWRYNLRARLHNFRARWILRRVLGIAAVGLWMLVPARLQEPAYRALVFRPPAA